jgi:hypothetical protein
VADGSVYKRVVAQNGATTYEGVTNTTRETLAFID